MKSFESALCLMGLLAVGCATQSPETLSPGLQVSPTREALSAMGRQQGRTRPDWRQKTYSRDGREILRHTSSDPDDDGTFDLHLYGIMPTDAERGRIALSIWVENGSISGLHNGPALAGLNFAVADLTKDGIPDYVCILDPQDGRTIEAFTLIDSILEPIPDDVLAKINSEGFYYDEEIPKLIQAKVEQGE